MYVYVSLYVFYCTTICLDAREWTNLLSLLCFIRLDLLRCAVCCTILTLKFTINETWSSWLCSVMSWLVSQAAAEMGVNGNRRFSTEGREFSFHRAALMRSVLRAETIFFWWKQVRLVILFFLSLVPALQQAEYFCNFSPADMSMFVFLRAKMSHRKCCVLFVYFC